MSEIKSSVDIAIVGMASLFPSAPDLPSYWHNIVSKVDAICDPPEDWEAEKFFDPSSQDNDRIYCKRGGYLGDLARFDPLAHGVMPVSVDGAEPDHFLALRLAHEALVDAGYKEDQVDPTRVGVILGRGTYINRGYTNLVQHGMMVDQTLRVLQDLHPEYTDDDLRTIKQELKASLPPFNAEVAPGLVPNIISGRIANRFNFLGTNYTVDAACASSLIAIDLGVRDLITNRCDMVIVGGVHASTPPQILMIFCQLNALSRSPHLRPFDKDADGTMLGEGVGVMVLKRLPDAERHGDRIYALIKGVGTASDGKALGLLTPRVEGEELATRRAYDAAGISPNTVALIEAHGTGTLVGDATEIQALTRVFGASNGHVPSCAIGSVKSMIGHSLPAAGAAGVIKIAASLHQKVLPPTLHCDEPNPTLELENTPFYINTEARPWIHGSHEHPRRAGVNAFGFGGINAHVILEEYTGGDETKTASLHHHWDTELIVLQGDSHRDLILKIEWLSGYLKRENGVDMKDLAYTLLTSQEDQSERLSIVASSSTDLLKKLEYAAKRLSDADSQHIQERTGIYYFKQPLGIDGKVVFMFPGEGSQYVNMLSDLCMHFPEVRSHFDLIDRAFIGHPRNYLPSQIIFPPPRVSAGGNGSEDQKLWQMDVGAEAVFAASQGMLDLLTALDLRPHFVVGHSTGEYSALLAAKALKMESEQHLIQHILTLNSIYERLSGGGDIPEGHLLAVGAVKRETIDKFIAESPEPLNVAMDNCPSQVVLCGAKQAIEQASRYLSSEGGICALLPFERAYHTPLFEPVCQSLKPFFDSLPLTTPETPIYSCVTAEPMPSAPEEIRDLALRQWMQPVRFRETIEHLYGAGGRIFVEVGPKGILTGFADDVLRGKPRVVMASDSHRRSGTSQLNHLLGVLVAHHTPLRLDALYRRRSPRHLSFERKADGNRGDSASTEKGVRLSLGLQPLRLAQPQKLRERLGRNGQQVPPPTPPPPVAPTPPVSLVSSNPMQAYFNTMEEFLNVQQTVLQQYLTGRPASSAAHQLVAALAPQTLSHPSPVVAPPIDALQHTPQPAEQHPQLSPDDVPVAQSSPVLSASDITSTVLDLVSEKTGYPIEMLGITHDLEADLGIDSIKRVEILGSARRALDLPADIDLEQLTKLKTLQEIIEAFSALVAKPSGLTPGSSDNSPLKDDQLPSENLALLGTITMFEPGTRLESVRTLDPKDDVFFRDHTLGGQVSTADENLTALPVMPLTMSMEILAQAAAVLAPGKVMVSIRDIRACRWIALDQPPVTLGIVAAKATGTHALAFDVRVREMTQTPGAPEPNIIEGTVVFDDVYPQAPRAEAFPLTSEYRSRQRPEELYSAGMFHGPTFRGVVSVDRLGDDGIEAMLEVLPRDHLFRSISHPEWVTDPILLDAAGQLVGYWAEEHLKSGFNVFPFRVQELQVFGPLPQVGDRMSCRARIRLDGELLMSSDIDLIGPDGSMYARLVGWEDRRFELPDDFYRMRIDPKSGFLSQDWPVVISRSSDRPSIACCRRDPFPDEFMNAHHLVWQRVLAHLILGTRDRTRWHNDFNGNNPQRVEWLLGLAVAKDAVRRVLRDTHTLEVCPADVDILSDATGSTYADGWWSDTIGRTIRVSIANDCGSVGAVACSEDRIRGIGLTFTRLDHTDLGRWSGDPLSTEEHALLATVPTGGGQWQLRFHCAKEAVLKALGREHSSSQQDVEVEKMDPASGDVWVSLRRTLATEFPENSGTPLRVTTAQDDLWITATTLLVT